MVHDLHAGGLRTNVADTAMLAWQHQARGGLREKKRTARICRHDAIPLFGGLVQRGAVRAVACVVDEDVEANGLGLDLLGGASHACWIREIERHRAR